MISEKLASFTVTNTVQETRQQHEERLRGRAFIQGGPKIGTIGQWRRRLECVVQQQGGHIEHLMQKLQDVTVT